MHALVRTIGGPQAHCTEVQLAVPSVQRNVILRIYDNDGGLRRPGLVYLHGGDFSDGCIDDAHATAMGIASDATVICVDYPLAPDAAFPIALETSYAVLEWVSCHARTLHVDPMRLFVGGRRAGGNLAAGVAMVARDRQFNKLRRRQLAGQALIAPLLDATQGTAASREAGHPYRRGWTNYLPRPRDFHHPYASPLHSRRLHGLAPALLVTGKDDPLRDEAMQYAWSLKDAKVPVQFHSLGASSPAMPEAAVGRVTLTLLRRFLSGRDLAAGMARRLSRGWQSGAQ